MTNGPVGEDASAEPMHRAPPAGAESFPGGLPEGTPARAAAKYTTNSPDVVRIMSGAQSALLVAIQLGMDWPLCSALAGVDQGPAAVLDVDSCSPVPVVKA